MSDSQKAVFLSYAREDTDAARRIAEALRGFGVEVWFDQSELRGGDAWDAKIRKQIKECALFVPIISSTTQSRDEGYFRREWKLAVDRMQDMGGHRAFIVPVVIDDTKEAGADVPEEFMRYQWTRLAAGAPTPEFVAQVKKLLESPKKSAAPATSAAPVTSAPAQPAPASRLPLVFGAIAVIAVGVAVFSFLRPAAKETISANPAAEAKPAPAAPPVGDKSVAVLAFADMSEARNSEYFSDGISEELLNVLAKVPGLKVAARTSAFHFKGKNVPIPEIARQLGVAYVVEGSVQRAGERVKITAQLIKAADGFHVWSDTFTRDAKDVFAVQEEIAGRIAKELSLKLGVSSAAATAAVNPEAFELYVQARQAWRQRTAAGYERAEELLNRALALEPNFARAISALADVWLLRESSARVIGGFDRRDAPAMKRILAQIERALALDPASAEAHASLGNARWNNWQVPEAARALRQAVALNPNYATAHQWLGRVLQSDGYFDEALAALRRAAELDPLSARMQDNYAAMLRIFERYTEALAADERALSLQPGSVQAGVWRALDLSGLGRHEEAVAQAHRMLLPAAGDNYERFLIEVLAKGGAREEAEALFKRLPDGDSQSVFLSLAALGRPQEALDVLESASLDVQDLTELLIGSEIDPLRQNPRFVQVIERLGLTEAHARAQAWRKTLSPAKPEAKK